MYQKIQNMPYWLSLWLSFSENSPGRRW